MTIRPGILAEVIGGAIYPSPNLGKIVLVGPYQGEHSLHGPIYRCMAEKGQLVSEMGVIAIALDFAADWLRPLVEDKQTEMYLESAA